MPKVTLPLGSAQAHGQLGKSLIFQGNTVKVYRAPVIQKVQGQLTAQDRFQSVTKTMGMLNTWGRGALAVMLGGGWYSLMVAEADNYWTEAETVYNNFSTEEKTNWTEGAPYQQTALDAGLVFYVCVYAVYKVGLRVQYVTMPFYCILATGHTAALIFWNKTLDDVFGSGIYDDTNAGIIYGVEGGTWGTVTDEFAMGGNYKVSQNRFATGLYFYFIGTRFGIIYKQSSTGDLIQMRVDGGANFTFSQNGADMVYQKQWTSETYARGLHLVSASHASSVGTFNIDGIVIYG